MVKYTASLPCICLIESDSKLYTNFEIVKEKTINICNTLIYKKIQAICFENYFFKKNLHISEDGTSSVQVCTLNTQLPKLCLQMIELY